MCDGPNKQRIRHLIRAHLEEGLDECRWCFAVDLARVKGTVLARHEFPDGYLEYLYCPRCKGEYSLYVPVWGEDYVKDRLLALHPELRGQVDEPFLKRINDRVLYPNDLEDYLDD